MMYADILRQFAAEGIAAARDAHGDNMPPAVVVWDFMRTWWDEIEEPALAYLPEEMPEEFKRMYEEGIL